MLVSHSTHEDYKALRVTSPSFLENGFIPEVFTCDGIDKNPAFRIDDIPLEAKSLTLIVADPDAPGKTLIHWLVCDIPITHQLEEGSKPGTEGYNDFGKKSYGGPCPPGGVHRYYFKFYALNALLGLHEGFSKADLEHAMGGHIVAYGELMGRYSRKR